VIRVDTIGELRGMDAAEFPSRGIILDADTISLRGFGLLYQQVDLLPAGELARVAESLCSCGDGGKCGVCKLVERMRAAGMVEGTP
jgi:hypothetical protein